jgi:hypothetical protein
MAEIRLFVEDLNIFTWTDIETFLIRSQYNELLDFVIGEYEKQYKPPALDKPPRPNFLNINRCLTIERCVGVIEVDASKSANAKTTGKESNAEYKQTGAKAKFAAATNICEYDPPRGFNMPVFIYERELTLSKTSKKFPLPNGDILDFTFDTNSLSVGAVIWLYFYERMGIFKILGALLDDYNYRGKYTISGKRSNDYSRLMDMISTLHRVGISSNLRDRVCLYQRVLGVGIENQLGIESERNSGFMNTFNRLIDYMLEYYKTKQLAQAIQTQAGTIQPRSSVATQTSIRDTINVLQQHFEPLQYGRNLINTFIGIATVHATLCLVNMLKSEIGIPAQYEKPEEFIPAAYDILVAKRTHTVNEANRFIIYDNCASYGYRLLTDIETIVLDNLTAIATGSNLDTWLNDIEGLVEGYRNAYSAVPEKVEAIV